MKRAQVLAQDIKFTLYRMSFAVNAVTRMALERRLQTLQSELQTAPRA